jgi:hypothetical protein
MTQGKVRRALVVCPISIMDSAWRNDLFNFAMHRTVDVAYGGAEKRKKIIANGAEFVIINYDGIEVVQNEIANGGFDLIIVDECFVAGTPVHTPDGLTLIENLRVGDAVFTSNGVHNISTVSKRKPSALVEVTLDTGELITCTPEHPFFTDWGWVPAKALAGRRIVSASSLPNMRGGVYAPHGEVAVSPKSGNPHWDDLLAILRSEEVAPTTSGGVSTQAIDRRATGVGRSVGVSPDSGAASTPVESSEGERAPPGSSRRERNWNDRAREAAFADAPDGVGMELPSSVGSQAARLSYALQARLRVARKENRVGGGWKQPPDDKGSGAGQAENGDAFGARVDSVTYRKPRSDEYVYNLEVAGTPNYFVGEQRALAHNCTHYKTATTKRWKVLNSLVKPETWVWLMTGTPAAQSPLDAYGLAKLVNPNNVPRFFGSFRDQIMTKLTQFQWVPKANASEVVFNALQPAIRFTKAECLDLPEMVYVKREIALTKQQVKYYNLLKQRMVMEAAGEEVTAVNAAVNMNKLLQISAGAVYADSGEALEFDIQPRYQVLQEVIAETKNKVLVFVPFKHTIDLLTTKLRADGVSTEVIRGDVPASKRTEIFKAFQEQPNPRVLVIQPQSAAHGVTLTAADTVVWWGPTPSLETYAQANARVHRTGQKNKCTVVQLYGSPVEKRVYAMLDNRIDVHTRMIELYKDMLD